MTDPVGNPGSRHRTWQDVLRAIGWPCTAVLLDWETYFDSVYTLSKLSTIEFIMDDRFEEFGVACVVQDQPFGEPQAKFWTDCAGQLAYLRGRFGENLERCVVIAHNIRFDGSILAFRHGIIPRYTVDTKGLAKYFWPRQSSSLKDVAVRLGIGVKGDTMQFAGRHMRRVPVRAEKPGHPRLSLPPVMEPGMSREERTALREYAKNDAILEWGLFKELLPRLSRPDMELPLAHHTFLMFARPMLRVNEQKAKELIGSMQAEIAGKLRATGVEGLTAKQVRSEKGFTRLLRQTMPAEKLPLKASKKGLILALAKADPELDLLLKHPNPRVRALIEARIASKSWPLHVGRVKRILKQFVATGRRALPVPLVYYGAHTGRWAGDEKINLQNLGSRDVHDLIKAVRTVLEAPEGWSLLIADASQVEARAVNWIAGQRNVLGRFTSGDPYCEFASEVLGHRVRKPRPSDPPAVAKMMAYWRTLGKVGELGCGYGMGADRCYDYAVNQYKLDITREMAKRVVDCYRDTHRKVCRFWTDLEVRFSHVTRYPQERIKLHSLELYGGEGKTIIRLPSGRELFYEEVRVVRDSLGRDQIKMPDPRKPGSSIYMWGGYLTENVIQATCRDLLVEPILAMERANKPVCLLVHDEIVALSPTDAAEQSLDLLVRLMSTSPAWAADLPLAAEGKISERYGK